MLFPNGVSRGINRILKESWFLVSFLLTPSAGVASQPQMINLFASDTMRSQAAIPSNQVTAYIYYLGAVSDCDCIGCLSGELNQPEDANLCLL